MDQGGGNQGVVVAVLVVALPGMTTADKNGVGPGGQTLQGKGGVQPTGTHDPDNSQVGRILVTADPSGIGGGIATPVAEKAENFGTVGFTH